MSENANEYKGSTVDEAIEIGLKELNLKETDVDVEIISHGGLLRKAKVSLKVKEKIQEVQPIVEEEIVKPTVVAVKAKTRAVVDAAEVAVLCDKAIVYLSGIIKAMNFDCEVSGVHNGIEINLTVTGNDANRIIGYRGDVIDAIQYLVLVYINKSKIEKDFVRVSIDADEYRLKREQILTVLAKKLALKVVEFKKPAKLEPMNPFERRIIHSALQDNLEVKTESFGEGKDRYVVILLKDATYKPSNFSPNDNRGFNNNRSGGRPYNNNRTNGTNGGGRPYNNNRNDRNEGGRPYNRDASSNNDRVEGGRPYIRDNSYNNNRTEGGRPYNRDNSYNNNRTEGGRPYNRDGGYNNNRTENPNNNSRYEAKPIENKVEENIDSNNSNFASDFKKTGPSKLKSFGYDKKKS